MVTLAQISEAVADALGMHPDNVLWIAVKLQRAGLLPGDGNVATRISVDPIHLSRLALAVAGTERPIDAAPLIEALERTPARELILRRSADAWRVDAAAVPQSPEETEFWSSISVSIVHAVALVVELYALGETDNHPCPRGVSLRRDATHPFATFEFGDFPAHPGVSRVLVYSANETPSPDDGLLVLASLDGQALIKLGRALRQWRGYPPISVPASVPQLEAR